MSTPAETLSQMIEAMTEESSKQRRRTHANAAYAALREMREAMPPANAEEAERRGYEAGWLAALALLRKTQTDVGEPMLKASYGGTVRHAAGAINALLYFGDTIITEFEKRATRAMREPYPEKTP